ncbi:hypothetical protein TraAM80_06800 [Trypanosoma rangeli]|uniref:Uncharacterized protein n=1 Tax=Trypanosoma rangeli TaxID=5698 RepID=A0A422N8M7_TRYRA|nr:uncharacterized protein TraAM80_06800 [Trypanosoma rangeli]RNF01803.1 hypothetical protein TraAM80_06800 [Trypanosoma rangeli]|eukprot:RNF01803.1 hypothetical protein TraAM80_06800 [Trypanosoma rangeli]
MVLPSIHDDKERSAVGRCRDTSIPVLINGVRGDPSFRRVEEVLDAPGGSEGRCCRFVTVHLAAALYLPVLQHLPRRQASDESRRWFIWRNFSEETLCIRRFTVERQVGGDFASSLVIAAGAEAGEWVTLPSRRGNCASAQEAFSVTLCRNGGERANVMVGFVVEVVTMLPSWCGEVAEETALVEPSSLVREGGEAIKKYQHVVKYGLTITW